MNKEIIRKINEVIENDNVAKEDKSKVIEQYLNSLSLIEMKLEYQNYIPAPPVNPKQLYGQACSSDQITMDTWGETWINQIKTNKEHFGSFQERSVGSLYNKLKMKPCIIIGSGPSLKKNYHNLKQIEFNSQISGVKTLKNEIPMISCLHNYHFLEDNGITPDYYVSLDAGKVTLEEVSEGGKHDPEYYWETTKDKTLIAYAGSYPELFKKWKGEVYLFYSPMPDANLINQIEAIESLSPWISTGGNVLGASLYISKAIMGANPICFVGADFSFSYTNKFHGWNSKYDKNLGRILKAVDVFGNRVNTWQSYFNFKNFFDYITLTKPGIYVNATEGGIFGAYPEGNIQSIIQMSLRKFILQYVWNKEIEETCINPQCKKRVLLF